PLRTAAPDDSCRRPACRARRRDRRVAALHERDRAPALAGTAVAYRPREAGALVHRDDPAPQGEKCRRGEARGAGVTSDREAGPAAAHSPLDPYGAVRTTAVPAARAPAVARYLRGDRAARVLAAVGGAHSLAMRAGFVVQQHLEGPHGPDKPAD